MERAGWRQRIVQFLCWKPSTHEQAWLYAVLGIGVPGFIIWSIIEHDQLYMGAIYAASVTLVGGLAQSKQLNRRRREDR